MQTVFKTGVFAILLVFGQTFISPAQAAIVTWDFNLPATALPSLNPPYPSIAELKLEDSTCGSLSCVKFTLDPNESNPGFNPGSALSTIDRLNIVFATTNSDETDAQSVHSINFLSGPATTTNYSWAMPPAANDANMDAGYTSQAGQVQIDWGQGSDPDFGVSAISMWTILNTTIADNFSDAATANNKPSPVFGIISVSPKIVVQDEFGNNVNPTPSNWVTGPSPVPVPAAVWLFGTALIGLVGFSRRKRSA